MKQFHTEDPRILGATLQNLVARGLCIPVLQKLVGRTWNSAPWLSFVRSLGSQVVKHYLPTVHCKSVDIILQ
jgi:hypothetical protein